MKPPPVEVWFLLVLVLAHAVFAFDSTPMHVYVAAFLVLFGAWKMNQERKR